MIGNFKIITLCGSTKFKEEFLREQKRLTLEGNIVISVGLFGHSGDDEVWLEDTKNMLDEMHKRKIDLADEIFVINVDGYIGSSTKQEIDYAIKTNKIVKYLEKPINPEQLEAVKEILLYAGISVSDEQLNQITRDFYYHISMEFERDSYAYPMRKYKDN